MLQNRSTGVGILVGNPELSKQKELSLSLPLSAARAELPGYPTLALARLQLLLESFVWFLASSMREDVDKLERCKRATRVVSRLETCLASKQAVSWLGWILDLFSLTCRLKGAFNSSKYLGEEQK